MLCHDLEWQHNGSLRFWLRLLSQQCVSMCAPCRRLRTVGNWRSGDAQIRACNDELTQLTSENTRCLSAVAEYTHSQMDMEDTLTNTQVRLCICLGCCNLCVSDGHS